MKSVSIFIFYLLVASFKGYGQPTGGPPATATQTGQTTTFYAQINLDIQKNALTSTVPYDEPFSLACTDFESAATSVNFYLIEGLNSQDIGTQGNDPKTRISISNPGTPASFVNLIFIDLVAKNIYLQHDKNYIFRIVCYDSSGKKIFTHDFSCSPPAPAGNRVKLDFGIAYSPIPKALIGVTSVHFYSIPINDATDLKNVYGIEKNLEQRISLFIGISPITISSNTEIPMTNLVGAGNFVYGIGIRSPFYGSFLPWKFKNKVGYYLLQPIRINLGEVVFKQANANPLISQGVIKVTPYFGISLDINLQSVFGPIGTLL